MGKLDGKVAVITGRRQQGLDEAVKQIGRNVTAVQGDMANLDDLDRLFDAVKQEEGRIDILYASAGIGEAAPLGEITEELFDKTFGLNARGTLFTVQKALPGMLRRPMPATHDGLMVALRKDDWKRFFGMLAKARFHGPVSLHVEYEVTGTTPAAEQENMLTAAARDLAFVKPRLAEAYSGSPM